MISFGNDDISAFEAKYEAQKIAFAPIMFQAALSLRNLGILEFLKKHKKGKSIEEIAQALKLPIYGVKVLLEAGLSIAVVRMEDEKFFITKTGWFICSDELTKVNMNFVQDVNYLGMHKLEDSIVQEKPVGLEVFGKWNTVYEALSELPENVRKSWFDFDHYYSDCAFPEILPRVFESNPRKILDVGGNTGKFSIKCAEYDKQVQISILDLPGQLHDAEKNIKQHGFSDRINGHSINLLDHTKAFPKGFDIIWMSQFLDCFSKSDVKQLLKRAYDAMDTNTRLFILETYWDNQKYEASMYSLHATSLYFTNIANGCSQMYSTKDMQQMLNETNIEIEKTYNDVGVSHTLYVCKQK